MVGHQDQVKDPCWGISGGYHDHAHWLGVTLLLPFPGGQADPYMTKALYILPGIIFFSKINIGRCFKIIKSLWCGGYPK